MTPGSHGQQTNVGQVREHLATSISKAYVSRVCWKNNLINLASQSLRSTADDGFRQYHWSHDKGNHKWSEVVVVGKFQQEIELRLCR